MRIDPYAWLVTVPLTIAMIQFWYCPEQHMFKRVWRQLQAMEAEIWFRLSIGSICRFEPAGFAHASGLYRAVIVIFCVLSLLSFAAFLGYLPA